MLRVAYVTPFACGTGHAVRGVALVQAAQRTGVDLRAFGPVCPGVEGYEGSPDWETRAAAFTPDLLLGDIRWRPLDRLRVRIGAPAWLLVRWVQGGLRSGSGWERLISIEPAADGLRGISDSIPPITVQAPRFEPIDGQDLQAGYNAWWEARRFGYHDRVRWQAVSPDQQVRIAASSLGPTNGAEVLMESIAAFTGPRAQQIVEEVHIAQWGAPETLTSIV